MSPGVQQGSARLPRCPAVRCMPRVSHIYLGPFGIEGIPELDTYGQYTLMVVHTNGQYTPMGSTHRAQFTPEGMDSSLEHMCLIKQHYA